MYFLLRVHTISQQNIKIWTFECVLYEVTENYDSAITISMIRCTIRSCYSLGITASETSLILTVLPFVSAIGPPIGKPFRKRIHNSIALQDDILRIECSTRRQVFSNDRVHALLTAYRIMLRFHLVSSKSINQSRIISLRYSMAVHLLCNTAWFEIRFCSC